MTLLRRLRLPAVAIALAASLMLGTFAAGTLEIWFVDVEGGQATLVVTPSGQSILIDAGYSPQNWRGATPSVPNGRDPSRILAAIEAAGISRLDYVLVTHFHPDHVGGVPDIAAKVPVGTFLDYGEPLTDDASALNWFRNYQPARSKGRHIVIRPGDRIALEGVDAEVVSAAGALLSKPLQRAGVANTACRDIEDFVEDGTENYGSIGVLLTYGAFSFLDLGDLSGNTLTRLACPIDMIGRVSAYLISHHGHYDSNVPALYAALRPQVAIMNNSAARGGDPDAFRTLHAQTAMDLWQLHFSRSIGVENAPDSFIANTDDGTTGHALHLSASADGSFRLLNDRNGFSKTYRR